jgi:type VI secretion system protein ImpD
VECSISQDHFYWPFVLARQTRGCVLNDITKHRIIRLIARIDFLINKQLNLILHHPDFQALEAAWRSLQFLISNLNQQKRVYVKILDVSFKELQKDLLNAIEFDQSQIFKKVYNQEYDIAGGQPYGLLVGNYQFRPAPRDFEMLQALMKISAAAFAPFVASVSPHMFGVNDYAELKPTLNFKHLFKLPQYQRWSQLRQEEDARFIGLTLPQFLLREPYNQYADKNSNRFFTEEPLCRNDFLWGSTAFAYAAVVCNTFHHSGWLADIRGISADSYTGGAIEYLPRNYFSVNKAKDIPKVATDIYLTDSQEKIFSEMGFISLRDNPHINTAVFYNTPSIQQPQRYSKEKAAQNAYLSGMLHYVLCASRFAHYVKIMIRDKIGKFISAEECEYFIQQWLLKYCAASQHISNDARAKYPLNEAKVKIHANISDPGKYSCTLYLKPHYQLDEIQTHLKLVTHITI